MGSDSNSKGAPKVVKVNKALKLAEAWVNGMSGSSKDDLKQLEFMGRPSRLGLGAKEMPSMKAAASLDPVEKRLLGKLNTSKRLSSKDSKKDVATEDGGGSDEDDEPESRTNSFAKKRAPLHLVTTPKSKKQK